jgi:hypothetical protein
MLLALMLLTPTVRANQMTFVANLAGVNAESILSRFARVSGVPSENSDSRTSMGCDAAMLGEQLASNIMSVAAQHTTRPDAHDHSPRHAFANAFMASSRSTA